MGAIGRRRLLESAGVLLAAGRISAGNVVSPTIEGDNAGEPLLLRNFEPRSMLHVPETKVLRSRYPVIDIHTHLSSVAKHAGGVGIGEEMQYFATAEDVLPLMDRKNLRIMVNLTGGVDHDAKVFPVHEWQHVLGRREILHFLADSHASGVFGD